MEPLLQPAREIATGGHELRYPPLQAAALLGGGLAIPGSLALLAATFATGGAWLAAAALFLLAALATLLTRYAVRTARTRIELDDVGIRRRCGRETVSIPWQDVVRVDAVRTPTAVVVLGPAQNSIAVDRGMVGAHVLDAYVARHVPDERIRFARTGRADRHLFYGVPFARDRTDPMPSSVASEMQEFEASLARSQPRVRVAPALFVLILAAYAWVGLRGGGWLVADPDTLIASGSNFTPRTLHGEPWRLWTATFLHLHVLHLALNLWALWAVGPLAERLFGPGRFLLLYTLAGIGGSLSSVLWHPLVNSVGASGALFGVFGALGAFFHRQRDALPTTVAGTAVGNVGSLVAINLLLGAVGQGVDNAAHVGGLLVGVLVGFALAEAPARVAAVGRSPRRLAATLVAAGLATVAVVVALRSGILHPRGNPAADLAWQDPRPGAPLRAIWGVSIGMSRAEVLARKGTPARESKHAFTYEAVDAAHDSYVDIVFDRAGRVVAVFYVGDGSGRPEELPAVNARSDIASLAARYGAPVVDRDLPDGRWYVRFGNGLVVFLEDSDLVVGIDYSGSDTDG